MRGGGNSKFVAILALAGLLALAVAEAHAAPQNGAQPPASPAPKPEEAAPAPAPGDTETPLPESKPVALDELTKDGFEIRSTEVIPAEAVTRQSGKVASDAIVVTLQKSTATAVCFYTLKAYVSKKLTTIPACTVHR
jgi:hypothetical protein